MAPLSKLHLAVVVWADAHHSLDEYSVEEVDQSFHKAAIETNYGLLIRSDDQGVTLAMEEGVDGRFRHTFFIPRAMIIEEIDLGVPKRPRVKKAKSTPKPPDPAGDF